MSLIRRLRLVVLRVISLSSTLVTRTLPLVGRTRIILIVFPLVFVLLKARRKSMVRRYRVVELVTLRFSV